MQIASLPGGTSADTTANPAFAKQAGIPLAAGYAPPAAAAAQPAEDANPCLGEDPGYTTGLAASFFAHPFASDAGTKGMLSLDFSGNSSFQRRVLGP